MARERSPLRDKAKELYINSKGTMKLVDIAEQLNLKDNQIRKWKSQDKWDSELKGTSKGTLPKKKVQSKSNVTNQKVTKKDNKGIKKEPIADEVKEVLENTELNEKQRLFCDYFVKYRNQVKAYQKAYKCSYINACRHAYGLRKNEDVNKEIDRQLKELRQSIKIDILDLIQINIDIVFSDMKDYVDWGMKDIEVQYKDGSTGTVNVNYVDFINAEEVDGTIISEVKKGKDGASIKLQDKQKAMDFLMKHLGYLDEETKRKIDIENKRLQGEKLKAETNRINSENKSNSLEDGDSSKVTIIDDIGE